MSRRDRRIARIRARPPEADFDDVQLVLKDFGWQQARQKGSHVTVVKAGEQPIVVPLRGGRKVARTYLVMICERLELDD